jgi:hypothetical protein
MAHEFGCRVHAIRAAAVRFRWLAPSLQIARCFQQSASQCDNAGVARAQVLLGAIRDRASVLILLDRNVLFANAVHAGETFRALLVAIEEIVVRTVGDRLERKRIDSFSSCEIIETSLVSSDMAGPGAVKLLA